MPAYVLEAEIELGETVDPRAVGAAVTVELCGHWEHEGLCTWPHNSAIDSSREPALFRTIYVAGEEEQAEIAGRIEKSLREAPEWRIVEVRGREVAESERELAHRLATGPRREH